MLVRRRTGLDWRIAGRIGEVSERAKQARTVYLTQGYSGEVWKGAHALTG